jgi:predicted dehydrogenase
LDELKVGLIGAGKMGLLHAGIFNSLEGCRISAIAEKDRFVTSILSKYLPGVNIYRDYEAMIEKEDLDIIAITTPVYLHKMMIEKAIDHYLNIFVEKPLALNGKECRSILAKNCRAKTEVGYPRRFMDTYNLAKNIIDASTLGDANYCHSQLFVGQIFKQGRGWLYDPAKSGGGVLMDLGSHVVDLLHHLFGEVSSVHGMGGSIFNQNVEDYISVNLKGAC